MQPIGCPETSVRNYHSAPRRIPKKSAGPIYTAAESCDHVNVYCCVRVSVVCAGVLVAYQFGTSEFKNRPFELCCVGENFCKVNMHVYLLVCSAPIHL